MGIIIKSEKEIEKMRRAGKLVATVLKTLRSKVKPGISTEELDAIAYNETKKLGGTPSFKGYHGFPASICASVNDEIVHGIPGKHVLKEGDIISIDFGAIVDGFQGDSAITVGVGEVNDEADKLMRTTENALAEGIKAARAGARLGDISAAIEQYAESKGYSVVREYTGHGIGREMHEDPRIPNCTQPAYGLMAGMGPELQEGMTLAIEPMVNIGEWRTRINDNNWTVLTVDGSLSAHFEHTIAITKNGPEILTRI